MYKKNGDGGGWMSPDGIKREEKTPPTVKKKKKTRDEKRGYKVEKNEEGCLREGCDTSLPDSFQALYQIADEICCLLYRHVVVYVADLIHSRIYVHFYQPLNALVIYIESREIYDRFQNHP